MWGIKENFVLFKLIVRRRSLVKPGRRAGAGLELLKNGGNLRARKLTCFVLVFENYLEYVVFHVGRAAKGDPK
jgi:hypothetical protein